MELSSRLATGIAITTMSDSKQAVLISIILSLMGMSVIMIPAYAIATWGISFLSMFACILAVIAAYALVSGSIMFSEKAERLNLQQKFREITKKIQGNR
jgi:uncharacterized paraquat-inducible protein A